MAVMRCIPDIQSLTLNFGCGSETADSFLNLYVRLQYIQDIQRLMLKVVFRVFPVL